jgi:hypothetical protein
MSSLVKSRHDTQNWFGILTRKILFRPFDLATLLPSITIYLLKFLDLFSIINDKMIKCVIKERIHVWNFVQKCKPILIMFSNDFKVIEVLLPFQTNINFNLK